MTVYALLGVGALLFAQAVVRLRRRGRPDLAGPGRVALFAAGLVLTWVALLSPLDGVGPGGRAYVLPTYTPLLELQGIVAGRGLARPYWERVA